MNTSPEPISLTERQRVSHTGLDAIARHFANGLAASLALNLLSDVGEAETTAFGTFRDNAKASMASITFRMVPFKGSVMLVLPVTLIQALVDLEYGGDGSFADDRKELLPSERRYFDRFESFAASAIAEAWKATSRLEANAIRLDLGCGLPPSFVMDQEVAVHSFELGTTKGIGHRCTLVTPTSMARGLPQENATPAASPESSDPVWQENFAEAIMQIRLPVRTIFARPELPLNRLLSLRPGEIIPLQISERLPVIVGGRRFAEGSIGEANGRAAIRIEKTLKGPAHHE